MAACRKLTASPAAGSSSSSSSSSLPLSVIGLVMGQGQRLERMDGPGDEILSANNALSRLDRTAVEARNIAKQQKDLEGELRTQSLETRGRFEELEGRLQKSRRSRKRRRTTDSSSRRGRQDTTRRRSQKTYSWQCWAECAKDAKNALIEREIKEHVAPRLHMVEPNKRPLWCFCV